MDESSRRFVRRVLILHLALLIVVVGLLHFAARDIYRRTRDHAIAQAQSRQTLLATQTARGIQGFYDSILRDLELRGEAEAHFRDRGGSSLMPMFDGVLLWKQLTGRAVQLFIYDKSTAGVTPIGSNDPALAPEAVAKQMEKWLGTVEKPAISGFTRLPGFGATLVCVPNKDTPQRLVVAVVSVPEIEARFLNEINADRASAAFLVDESLTAMAASSPQLVGVKMDSFSDPRVSALATHYVQSGRTGSEIIEGDYKLGEIQMWPSIVTAMPINAVNKKWQLFVASPLTEIDTLVEGTFKNAILWSLVVIVSVTAILVSSSIQLIRGRLRVERVRHELLKKELDEARKIQLAWLPETSRMRGSLDIAAVNKPASHISGDFYNWFELPDGRTVVTIGDVTGHGMSAAFLMATTQLLVRSTMMRLGETARCLEEVNNQLCAQAFNGQFVTILLCVFDLERGEVEIATAGHPAPIFHDGTSWRQIEMVPQLILGVEADTAFPTERIKLPSTSSFVLYTDGVPDCLSAAGERFKVKRLMESLNGRRFDTHALLDGILSAVHTFRGPRQLADDLTLVTIEVQPVTAQKPAGVV